MKLTSKKMTPLCAAAVCLSLGAAGLQADPPNTPDTPNNASGNPPIHSQYVAPTDSTHSVNDGSNSAQNENQSANHDATADKSSRASCLIGMAVRNQNDEHLGKIKDIVIDLKSDRVAYAVMSASGTGTLGFHEKMVAVPLNAFTVSADHKYLTLRADKAKLEAAAGFDTKNWPDATNPSWGAEPFWQSDNYSNKPYPAHAAPHDVNATPNSSTNSVNNRNRYDRPNEVPPENR